MKHLLEQITLVGLVEGASGLDALEGGGLVEGGLVEGGPIGGLVDGKEPVGDGSLLDGSKVDGGVSGDKSSLGLRSHGELEIAF